MKFTISQTEFLKAINIGSRSLLSKSNLPILSNILVSAKKDGVEFLATNLETACRVKVDAKVEREGETSVVGRTIGEFLSQLDSVDIVVEKLGEELVLGADGVGARFGTMDPAEFPAIPKVDGGMVFSVSVGDLTSAVSAVAFCAAVDESRPILTGVLCQSTKKGLSLVATDGFRLGYAQMETSDSTLSLGLKFIIPAKALAEIAKISEEVSAKLAEKKRLVNIAVSGNLTQAIFKIGEVEFTSRLIEGTFPSWEKLIPSEFSTKATISKQELVRVVKIASIFARDAGNIVRLRLRQEDKKSQLSVSSAASQIGSSESTIKIDLAGNGGEIAFNFRYILEALSVTSSEQIVFEMNESLNPGKISPADANFFHIIMPVRLQA